IVVYQGGGHLLGFFVAGLCSAVLSLLFAFVTLGFRANQVAAGLAIGILCQCLSALFGKTGCKTADQQRKPDRPTFLK
ncbi:hypothetical protein AB9F42_35975, partial [Rhizobium leguminosarum]